MGRKQKLRARRRKVRKKTKTISTEKTAKVKKMTTLKAKKVKTKRTWENSKMAKKKKGRKKKMTNDTPRIGAALHCKPRARATPPKLLNDLIRPPLSFNSVYLSNFLILVAFSC